MDDLSFMVHEPSPNLYHIIEGQGQHVQDHSECSKCSTDYIAGREVITICGIRVLELTSLEELNISEIECKECLQHYGSGQSLFTEIDEFLKNKILVPVSGGTRS